MRTFNKELKVLRKGSSYNAKANLFEKERNLKERIFQAHLES